MSPTSADFLIHRRSLPSLFRAAAGWGADIGVVLLVSMFPLFISDCLTFLHMTGTSFWLDASHFAIGECAVVFSATVQANLFYIAVRRTELRSDNAKSQSWLALVVTLRERVARNITIATFGTILSAWGGLSLITRWEHGGPPQVQDDFAMTGFPCAFLYEGGMGGSSEFRFIAMCLDITLGGLIAGRIAWRVRNKLLRKYLSEAC